MNKRFDWQKALALGIDLVVLWMVSMHFIGPVMASAQTMNSVDHLMSQERLGVVLAQNAVSVAMESARIGGEALVFLSAAYFFFLHRKKRRSLGRVVVDHFTAAS